MLPFQTLPWSSVTRSCFGTDGLLVKILSAEPAMPDSLGTREVIGNPRQTCPIFTGRWRLLGPNPRPRPRYNVLLRLHHRSGANLIRMLAGLRSLPLQARLHRLRRPVTRGGRIAWGSVGTRHAFSTPNGPRLCLRSFSCCLGARLRDLTFNVDPHDPRIMIDVTRPLLYYKGNLRMHCTVLNPHRRLQAITAEDDEWIVL